MEADSSTYTSSITPPEHYICPITCELMTDPLVSIHGHHYQSDAILAWLNKGNNTCPLTRKPLSLSLLVSNRVLRATIHQWMRENGLENPDHTDHAEIPFRVSRLGCIVAPSQRQISGLMKSHASTEWQTQEPISRRGRLWNFRGQRSTPRHTTARSAWRDPISFVITAFFAAIFKVSEHTKVPRNMIQNGNGDAHRQWKHSILVSNPPKSCCNITKTLSTFILPTTARSAVSGSLLERWWIAAYVDYSAGSSRIVGAVHTSKNIRWFGSSVLEKSRVHLWKSKMEILW